MKRSGSFTHLFGGGQNGPDIFLHDCSQAHLASNRSSNSLGSTDSLLPDLKEDEAVSSEEIMEKGFAASCRKSSYGTIATTSEASVTNLSIHPVLGASSRLRKPFPLAGPEEVRTIRFQVIVWYIGAIDVLHGNVDAKVRITLFWNATDECNKTQKEKSSTTYVMQGRRCATKKVVTEGDETIIDVPPVSILNAVSFSIVGSPDVTLLNKKEKLMRWSCLYKVSLLQAQEDMKVDNFPHDQHKLTLKLGILTDRQKGGKWDHTKWKLALAKESDTKHSIRIPHGMIVDHVKIPQFSYDRDRGLDFCLTPLEFGTGRKDQCLRVELMVRRESGYYDKNIMPLLMILHTVAVSLFTMDATDFFKRGLMTLNITFVEIGLRSTLDSHLPKVGYEIKLQRIMNAFFLSLLFCVLESSCLYYLTLRRGWSIELANEIDFYVALGVLSFGGYQSRLYYKDQNFLPPKLAGQF
mmetsp:Transcript_14837/g.32897  ORF Transcript_14837/g.32897 Transcript_14837/m.32897 type:complete len:466 (-) Transcript_14837:175-1572(-)